MSNWYSKYKSNYLNYLKKLGYGDHNGDFDFTFIKSAFIYSWSKPGFHLFWRYWNPGLSFLTLKLYKSIGGKKNRFTAVFLSFVICGLIHNIIVYPFLGWSYTIVVAFFCFACFTLISKTLEPVLNQSRWHWVVNSLINILLVVMSFDIGFKINHFIYSNF